MGILSTNVGWALIWAIQGQREVSYGLRGDVSILNFNFDSGSAVSSNAFYNQAALRSELTASSVSLVAAAQGEGRPEMVVFDQKNMVPWFPHLDPEAYADRALNVYAIEGTFSAQEVSQGRTIPYIGLPSKLKGTVTPPAGTGDLQYARPLQDVHLSPGTYVLNTTDHRVLDKVIALIQRDGLRLSSSQQVPLKDYLRQDPLFVISCFIALAGYSCAATFWWLAIRFRKREFAIRTMHGATTSGLVKLVLVQTLPVMIVGNTSGSLGALSVVSGVSASVTGSDNFNIVLSVVVSGLVLTVSTYVLTVVAASATLRRRYLAD